MKVYVSCDAFEQVLDKLKRYGDIVLLPPFSKLDNPVSSHADMLLFHSDMTGKTFLPEEYCIENSAVFEGIKLCTVPEKFSSEYPFDVWLDCCKMGKYLFCNEKFTSQAVKEGYAVVNVKQGYAGCSVLKLGAKALISADRGICKKATELGIDTLEISSGGVNLNGYSCGFIGGASFVCGNEVLFFGDVTHHPDYQRILDFILKHGMTMDYIKGFELTDFGSAVIVDD